MSKALAQLIERASTDAGFRAQLRSNPEAVLADYDLTAEEKAALLSGDPGVLLQRGVDQRVSKWASGQSMTSEQDSVIEWFKGQGF